MFNERDNQLNWHSKSPGRFIFRIGEEVEVDFGGRTIVGVVTDRIRTLNGFDYAIEVKDAGISVDGIVRQTSA